MSDEDDTYNLSDAEKAHALDALRYDARYMTEANFKRVLNVWRLEYDVRDFERTIVGGVSDLVMWMAQVLFHLSGGTYEVPGLLGSSHGKPPVTTVEELRARFEADAAEAQSENEWSLANDAKYADYHRRCNRSGHVWGDDEVDACRRWLNESAYRVWYVKHEVEEATFEAVREDLIAMAADVTGGDSVAKAAQETLEKVSSALGLRYLNARNQEALDAKHEASWDASPLGATA
jgi:hypothetical protein